MGFKIHTCKLTLKLFTSLSSYTFEKGGGVFVCLFVCLIGYKNAFSIQAYKANNVFNIIYFLKPLAGRPGLPGLKCTSAAAPT